MKIERLIRKRIRKDANGVSVAVDVNMAIAGDVADDDSSVAHAEAHSNTPIVQTRRNARPW